MSQSRTSFPDRAEAPPMQPAVPRHPTLLLLLGDDTGADARLAYAIDLARRAENAALSSHASRIGADIVVMGAWGRPRVVERVLGGATRDVLARMHRPVLFSH